MNLIEAAACLILWRSGRFDTKDIADYLGVTEPDVCRVLDAVRQQREHGPDLHLVAGVAE
jgi:DNA-binding MarR family transcriptional regulator